MWYKVNVFVPPVVEVAPSVLASNPFFLILTSVKIEYINLISLPSIH